MAATTAPEKTDECPDGDLFSVVVVAWFVSLARVVIGVVRGETFGAEPTLAFLATVFLPLPLMRVVGWWLRRRGRPAPSEHSGVYAQERPESHC